MFRPARPEDWPAIASWRAAHFAKMLVQEVHPRPITGQKMLGDAVWLVAEKEGRAVAALSYTEDPAERRRFLHDLYAEPGLKGGLAALALGEFIERMADAHGYELRADTDPENLAYLRVLTRRGFEITAVQLRRTPRPPREP